MIQAALKAGTAHRQCVFELFTRRLPAGRRYGVVAGTGRFLELLQSFTFTDEDLRFLSDVVDEATIDFLANYRFSGTITGYAEGEIYFPGSPIMTVQSSFAEGVLLETLALSILNYDSAVASAASRMVGAAAGRPCLEMGSRRAHELAAVAAARAAVIAGFSGTSNLEAARQYGLDAIGTAAHAFTLLHDDEETAFRAQIASLGTGTTLLVDTYDVTAGVETAIRVAGADLAAVRLDSGDLGYHAVEVRKQLDALGATGTDIVVTSDLDEYAIAALAVAPVNAYGVGTSVVTGSGAPTCSMVYKLVERQDDDGNWVSVAKASTQKTSVGGLKHGVRRLDARGRATVELILTGDHAAVATWQNPDAQYRDLQVPLVTDGQIHTELTGADGVQLARERHRLSVRELPTAAVRLSRGDPVLPTQLLDVSAAS